MTPASSSARRHGGTNPPGPLGGWVFQNSGPCSRPMMPMALVPIRWKNSHIVMRRVPAMPPRAVARSHAWQGSLRPRSVMNSSAEISW